MTDRVPRKCEKINSWLAELFCFLLFLSSSDVVGWRRGMDSQFMQPSIECYEVEEFDNVFISEGVNAGVLLVKYVP